MEGERYRTSALTGGVPIKVLDEPVPQGLAPPFADLLLPVESFASRMREMDFFQVRDRFLGEYRGAAVLGVGIGAVLPHRSAGSLPPRSCGNSPRSENDGPPGVTIAIPNWNHEAFLPRSIGSGLAAVKELRRHGLDGEVLVVDDQSRDGSPMLLRQLEALYYADGLRVLALAQNGGVCRARNEALRRARHCHVLVMDADNEVIPENVILFHRAMNDTGAAVVYGNQIIHEWHQPKLRLYGSETFQPKIFEENYIDNFSMLDRDQALALTNGYARIPASGPWVIGNSS